MRTMVVGSCLFLLVLILFPFFSAAQELLRESSPEFSVVSPLDREVVSGSVGFLLSFADPTRVDRAVIRSSDDSSFEASFSAREGWLVEWDSSSVENGLHSFVIEVCSGFACSEKSVTVDVRNIVEGVLASPSDSRGGRGSNDSSPPETDGSSFVAPVPAPVLFTPSNHAGAFELLDRSGEVVSNSSGGVMRVPAGSYSARFTYWDQPFSRVELESFDMRSDSTGVLIDSAVLPPVIGLDGELFYPSSGVHLFFGVDSPRKKLVVSTPLGEKEVLVWCPGVVSTSGSCPSPLRIVLSSDDSFFIGRDSEGFLFRVVPLGRDRPFEGVPVSVTFSNHPGSHVLISSDGSQVEGGERPVPVLPGTYSLVSSLLTSPLAGIVWSGVSVSKEGILTEITNYPPSKDDGSQIIFIRTNVPFESGSYSLSPSTDASKGEVCARWDPSSLSCVGEWVPRSDSRLVSSSSAYRLYSFPSPDAVLDDLPLTEQEALAKALADLKLLFENRAFSTIRFTEGDSLILSSLFTRMEISLECGPQRREDSSSPLPAPSLSNPVAVDSPFLAADGPSLPNEESLPADSRKPDLDESSLDNRGDGESRDGFLSCDSVSLQNVFNEFDPRSPDPKTTILGDSLPHVKQSLVLTNSSDVLARRLVNIRLWARPFSVVTESRSLPASSRYQVVHTREDSFSLSVENSPVLPVPILLDEYIEFRSRENAMVGRYDWSDYWRSGVSPVGLVHTRDDVPIIDTLIYVDVPARDSVVVDPTYELNTPPNFSAAWDGNMFDAIGGTFDSNSGVQLVNVDNNAFANDLLITAPMADINGKANNGAVYLIRDINQYAGIRGLFNFPNFAAIWNGGIAGDMLGRTGSLAVGSGTGVQLLDVDGNGYTNDLILTTVNGDVNNKVNNGGVYLIRDIDKKYGAFDLNSSLNYSVAWGGSMASLFLGDTNLGGQGVQVVNLDGNLAANDLIITNTLADFNRTDSGSIYIIRDINTMIGYRDLNLNTSYNIRFDGNGLLASNLLGGCGGSGNCTQVVNLDGNARANDLLITSTGYDCNTLRVDCGAVTVIKDIVNIPNGIRGLSDVALYSVQWVGGALLAGLGNTRGYGSGTQLFDLNGDGFTNDLILTAPLADLNNLTDNGAVYFISDINTLSGTIDLNSSSNNFTAMWSGGRSSDNLGTASPYILSNEYVRPYVRLYNLDGNKTANDMFIAASLADFNLFTNNGMLYYISDINTRRGRFDLNTSPYDGNPTFNASWYGSASNEEITRTQNEGWGFDVLNVDGNASVNDVIIGSGVADVNGKTDPGVWYFIRDVNNIRVSAARRYLSPLTYHVRLNGGAGDRLSDNNFSGPPFYQMNTDGNANSDDFLFVSPYADVNNKLDNGAIYLIRDMSTLFGTIDLNSIAPAVRTYNVRWSGANAWDMIGDANGSDPGVYLANMDGDTNVDDFFIVTPRLDNNKTNQGGVYFIRNIGLTDGNRNLDFNTNYTHLWQNDNNNDALGDNNRSGFTVGVYNTDGNALANDLLILSSQKDMNNFVNNGAVYLIKDINSNPTPNGILTFRIDNPAYDGNSYQLSMNINVSARITCRIANCGAVDTNIQYCIGRGCVNFIDLNTNTVSPLYILSGTNPDQNASLLQNESYDVNWTLKSNDANVVYTLRFYSVGTTSGPSIPPEPQWYIHVDPNNSYDLLQGYNYQVRFDGATSNDYLGMVGSNETGVYFVNIDNGAYNNDLILLSPQADVNNKADAGALYLFKNFDMNSGNIDLNKHINSYSARWWGGIAGDRIGDTNFNGPGFQIVNVDGNSYSNDLLLVAPVADANGKTNNGAVYLMKDIDRWDGNFDLNFVASSSVRFTGSWPNELMGNANRTDSAVQLVDLDGNGYSNDLLISAAFADQNFKRDAGRLYMILDINTLTGIRDMNANQFNAAWNGTTADDYFTSANTTTSSQQEEGLYVLNTDGNSSSNDLLVLAPMADVNSKSNVGVITLIKDAHRQTGNIDLNVLSFNAPGVVQWNGGRTSDTMGFNNGSGPSVQIVNLDGNGTSNDLFIIGSAADGNKADTGIIYLIKDINVIAPGRYDLNIAAPASFTAYWEGGSTTDSLGDTSQSGQALQVVNLDGNTYSNDIVLNVPLADTNGKTNIGSVYVILDVQSKIGRFDLNVSSNANAQWRGQTANDQLGDFELTGTANLVLNTGNGVQVVNMDGNSITNDLLITASGFDYNGKTDAGVVFGIKDANTWSGIYNIAVPYAASFTVNGGATTDNLGDTNRSGVGVQLVNVDNNAWSNDLLLSAIRADVNGRTDAGAVYLIKDISSDANGGRYDLNAPLQFDVRWVGDTPSGNLGASGASGLGVQLKNLDNGSYTNDLLITSTTANTAYLVQNGAIYLDRNIDSDAGLKDLKDAINYDKRWRGARANDMLGAAFYSEAGVQVINADNDSYANDLLITDSAADANFFFRTNNGAVYYVPDVVTSGTVDYSFVLFLPSSGCTSSKGNLTGGTSCQRAYFEATDTNGPADSNQIAPEGQSASQPFFVYDNQSTSATDFNIILDLNQSLPSSLVLKASNITGGYQAGCGGNPALGCVSIPAAPSTQSVGRATYTTGTRDLNIFFWADFIAAAVGNEDRNVDSNTVA